MTALECMDRVTRGFAALDETRPRWVELVDADILDMGSIEFCVLAQVYPEGYNDGLEWVALQERGWSTTTEGMEWAYRHGFDAGEEDRTLLNTLWRNRIRARQRALV